MYNKAGYDRDGFNRAGYDRNGCHRDGYLAEWKKGPFDIV